MKNMRANLVKIAFIVSTCLVALAAAAADAPGFMLDLAATSNEPEIQLTVPPTGEVAFSLIQTTVPAPPPTIDLHVSQFSGEQGNTVEVNLIVPGVSGGRAEHYEFQASNLVTLVKLSVPRLPTAGKYRGSLILTSGQSNVKVWKLALTRAAAYQPATLVLDQQIVSREFTKPWRGWRTNQGPEFTVRLWDKSGQWDLEGVDVRVEQVAKAPGAGFDLRRNLDIKCDGKPLSIFTDIRGNGTDVIVPAGHPATVTIGLRNLKAGEYSATLRFTAANSAGDDAAKLLLAMHVRHSPFWAFLVLLFALALSFIGTKMIGFARTRFALLKRISDLRGDWLQDEPAVLPVVWARAVLLQCEELSKRLWLRGIEVVDDRVTQVSSVVQILDLVHQTREELGKLRDGMVAYRANAALERIVGRIGPRPLDEQSATNRKAELSELLDWLKEDKRNGLYWDGVSADIHDLLAKIKTQEVPQHPMDAVMSGLSANLEKALSQPPKDLNEMIKQDSDYARLKILWERRDWGDDAETLIKLQNNGTPLEDFFRATDELTWKHVKMATNKHGASAWVIPPQSTGPELFEAYHPLVFRLTTSNPALDATYLIWHGLKYKWTFTRTELGRSAKNSTVGTDQTRVHENAREKVVTTFMIETDHPEVVEYAQDEGNLNVKVEIYRSNNKSDPVEGLEPVPIGKSKDFSYWKSVQRTELGALALASLFAIITGLSAIYFKDAGFGSFQSYLLLFLWGVGVDQTKNAIQILQTYAPQPVKI